MTRKALEDVMTLYQWFSREKLVECKRELDRRNRYRQTGQAFCYRKKI